MRSISEANPKMWMRVPGPVPGEQHALAPQRGGQAAEQVGLHPGPRVVDVHLPVGGVIGLRPAGGEQRPVDAVLGHQLGRLGRQGLRLGGGHAVGFRLGQQLAHAIQEGGGGLRSGGRAARAVSGAGPAGPGPAHWARRAGVRAGACSLRIHESSLLSGTRYRMQNRTVSGRCDICRGAVPRPHPTSLRPVRARIARHPGGRPRQTHPGAHPRGCGTGSYTQPHGRPDGTQHPVR